MTYNPATDFLSLWRNIAGQVSKVEIPGLDFVVAALARASLITLSVSATAPVSNQPTTAWLKTAVPSNSAEGALMLWNTTGAQYVAATPALFIALLEASAGQSGVSWWTANGGPPSNTVGNNGDFSFRLDAPFGAYGPKALGAWPLAPIPGTADVITSTSLDNTFGTTPGALIVRGAAAWQALEAGAPDTILSAIAGSPTWENLSSLLDLFFGAAQGSILYRDAGLWEALAPGAPGQVLKTQGTNANPAWGAETPDVPSGTVMLFYQATAPVGWTQVVTLNDYGIRIVTGPGGTVTPGTAFSTVFAQTTTGNTTITQATMPSHAHNYLEPGPTGSTGGGGAFGNGPAFATTTSVGGDGPHAHPVQLNLSYADFIIASKN